MMRRCSRTSGFTLIEVLVALAIVSIGMLAVIQSVTQAVSNGAYLRDKTIAHWVAMNQLTTMRLSQSPPAIGTSSGNVEMAKQQWHWTAEVATTPVTTMKRIDVAVRLATGDEDSELASVTGFVGERIAKPGTIIAQWTQSAPSTPPNPAPK